MSTQNDKTGCCHICSRETKNSIYCANSLCFCHSKDKHDVVCKSSPHCSHNTNGRSMDKPCSIAVPTQPERKQALDELTRFSEENGLNDLAQPEKPFDWMSFGKDLSNLKEPENIWRDRLRELWMRDSERDGRPYLINIESFVATEIQQAEARGRQEQWSEDHAKMAKEISAAFEAGRESGIKNGIDAGSQATMKRIREVVEGMKSKTDERMSDLHWAITRKQNQTLDRVLAHLDKPTEDRCIHGVHGTDCFKCYKPIEGEV